MEFYVGLIDGGVAIKPLIENRITPAIKRSGDIKLADSSVKRYVRINLSGKSAVFMLADILSDIIIENLQIRILMTELKSEYSFIPDKEQCDILTRALKKLWFADNGAEHLEKIKKDVSNRIAVCLFESNGVLSLDGIIRFRMKDYTHKWCSALDDSIEEYLKKTERQEFIGLLRYFVSMREPQKKAVHVYMDTDGKYNIKDENGKPISVSISGAEHGIEKAATDEDLLLSKLICIAPEVIVLENEIEKDLCELITKVFIGRVRNAY